MLGILKLGFVLTIATFCETANILYAIPYSVKSHYIMQRPVGLELARRGHNVTVLTAHREIDHPPNYHQVMVSNKTIWDVLGRERPNIFTLVEYSAEQFHREILWKGGLALTEGSLKSPEVQSLLAENRTFDLVISELFFQEATYALAHKYNAPLILISTMVNCMKHSLITGNPLELATTSFEFLDAKNPTSFWGRLRNLYLNVYDYFWWRYWFLEKQEELVKKYIPNLPQPVPSLYDMEKNASLLFLNSHFSFQSPVAFLPNIIEIGGIHLKESDSQLPDDLQKLLDDATEGVVYVNFGSNVQSSELPIEKKNALINVFKRLNQTVLWKWEAESLDEKPDNVVVRKWMPQKEILSHPNIKVFISHGGLIGTLEAVFHGVPIIGIPVYGDQYKNLIKAEEAGGSRPNVFQMVEISAEKFHENVLWKGGLAFTELTLNSTQIRRLLQEDTKFDLVINEQFYQEAMNVLAYKYNAPMVLVTTFGNCMRHNIVARNPLQLATVLSEFLPVRNPTTFWARMRNWYFTIYEYVYWRFWFLEEQEKLVRKYLPDLPKPVPSLYDLQKNASLILLNGHFSFDTPAAYLPNVVEIGGVHLTKSDTKLPEDLQKILDNAKDGAVYMNFGSNVRSSELPEEKRRAFLNVFRKLKQTVLWKWEDDNLENKPDNLIVRKWLPQKEILSHPNVRVFISHGGLIGTQEAIYHGVPIIGIPIYADQYNNLLQAESYGFGKILEYHDINEATFSEMLHEVLTNESYRVKAKELSTRFKDRPMDALETAMFWIEYVIRNKGAHYMKNPALDLSWFAYTMIDVYAFVLILVLGSLYVIMKIFKLISSLFEPKSTKKQKKH